MLQPQLDRKGQLVYLEKEKLLLTPSSSVELSKLVRCRNNLPDDALILVLSEMPARLTSGVLSVQLKIRPIRRIPN